MPVLGIHVEIHVPNKQCIIISHYINMIMMCGCVCGVGGVWVGNLI